jgi:hypothetical protein
LRFSSFSVSEEGEVSMVLDRLVNVSGNMTHQLNDNESLHSKRDLNAAVLTFKRHLENIGKF